MADDKRIQIRLRPQKESPQLMEWLDNQTNISNSIRELIELQISRYGTGDMSAMAMKMKIAQDQMVLSGTVTPQIQSPSAVKEVPVSVPVVETKPVEKVVPVENKEEQPQRKRVVDRGESNL